MTDKKCLKVIAQYRNKMEEKYYDTEDWDHVRDMLREMPKFLANRREKFMRWLGFIQGVLWVQRVYSLEELKDHNRPEEETYEPVEES